MREHGGQGSRPRHCRGGRRSRGRRRLGGGHHDRGRRRGRPGEPKLERDAPRRLGGRCPRLLATRGQRRRGLDQGLRRRIPRGLNGSDPGGPRLRLSRELAEQGLEPPGRPGPAAHGGFVKSHGRSVLQATPHGLHTPPEVLEAAVSAGGGPGLHLRDCRSGRPESVHSAHEGRHPCARARSCRLGRCQQSFGGTPGRRSRGGVGAGRGGHAHTHANGGARRGAVHVRMEPECPCRRGSRRGG